MPRKSTIRRARKDARQGKSPSTQAGEFVREEIEDVRKGIHGVANVKQAIAIGLSKARKAGIPIPARGKAAQRRRKPTGAGLRRESARKRGRVARQVLERMPRSTVSRGALSRQARSVAKTRGAAARSAAARKAVRTKGPVIRHRAAVKAARTRQTIRRGRTR
jgi:hypothetical protein